MSAQSYAFTYYRLLVTIYILLGYHSNNAFFVLGNYPFTTDDLNSRQESILERLRNDMSLAVNENNIPKELKGQEHSLHENLQIRNLEVGIYCYVVL